MQFDNTILANWILSGVRFIHYRPRNNYALLAPLFYDKIPIEGYVIPIADEQALEMANGVDDFEFYVNHK